MKQDQRMKENIEAYEKGLEYYIYDLEHYCRVHERDISEELRKKIYCVSNVYSYWHMKKWFGIQYFIDNNGLYRRKWGDSKESILHFLRRIMSNVRYKLTGKRDIHISL